jgi:hypothetical protein
MIGWGGLKIESEPNVKTGISEIATTAFAVPLPAKAVASSPPPQGRASKQGPSAEWRSEESGRERRGWRVFSFFTQQHDPVHTFSHLHW